MKKNTKGFTLIELLVVIAIIGLLSTLSIVALNNARARARDARRLSDIKQMQTALELYYNDNGIYPLTANVTSTIATTGVVYMQVIPTAPTPADGSCSSSNTYAYNQRTITTAGDSYTLSYCIGQTVVNGPTGSVLTSATPAGIK